MYAVDAKRTVTNNVEENTHFAALQTPRSAHHYHKYPAQRQNEAAILEGAAHRKASSMQRLGGPWKNLRDLLIPEGAWKAPRTWIWMRLSKETEDAASSGPGGRAPDLDGG